MSLDCSSEQLKISQNQNESLAIIKSHSNSSNFKKYQLTRKNCRLNLIQMKVAVDSIEQLKTEFDLETSTIFA